MKRGFFSVVLTLAMVAFFARDMQLNNLLYGGAQEMKNDLALGIAINEEAYGLGRQ